MQAKLESWKSLSKEVKTSLITGNEFYGKVHGFDSIGIVIKKKEDEQLVLIPYTAISYMKENKD